MSSSLDHFRAGVRFSERLVRNLGHNTRWTWRSARRNINRLNGWCTRNGFAGGIFWTLAIITVLAFIIIVLPFSLLWAIIRSI